jgi:hypothetical protein
VPNKIAYAAIVAATVWSVHVAAAEVTYTKDIAPIFKEWCSECHGAESPVLHDFLKDEKKFTKEKTGPRMNSYADLIFYIGWPDTGALMRRLDDGKTAKDGKAGNMYTKLGSDDAERQKNLKIFKAWVGEGGWNLNRWTPRGEVPAISKEQLDKLLLKP